MTRTALVLLTALAAGCSSATDFPFTPDTDGGQTPDGSAPADSAVAGDAPILPGTDAATPVDAADHDGASPAVDAGKDSAEPVDAGDDSSTGNNDAGLLAFGASCSQNAQCESNLCFNFNAKGPHCTLPCNSAADCPGGAAGLGCSGMNVCKVP